MLDAYGRKINYMRVSVTDKCNLRCRYCMPEGVEIVPMEELLTMEEIAAVCRQAARMGIDRIKITGGEPLVRRGVVDLIRILKQEAGIRQVTMTTNGILLSGYLSDLIESGLDAVNISLDTLDPKTFHTITGRDQLDQVLKSIDDAVSFGLPVKINSVLMRGVNEDGFMDLIRLAMNRPVDVRFIEMMPIGAGAVYESIANSELMERMKDIWPDMVRDMSIHGNGPAIYYRIPGFQGSIGFISAIHGKFCGSCNRIRMTAMGDLKPCLCYDTSVNVREALRNQGEEAVEELLKKVIYHKPEAHCFEELDQITERHKMIAIGG